MTKPPGKPRRNRAQIRRDAVRDYWRRTAPHSSWRSPHRPPRKPPGLDHLRSVIVALARADIVLRDAEKNWLAGLLVRETMPPPGDLRTLQALCRRAQISW